MNSYKDTFKTVNVNGTFNGWCGSCNTLTDADKDGIYEITMPLNANDTFEYLYTLDGWRVKETWAGGESCTKTTGTNTNRMSAVAKDSALPAVCWEKCVSCLTAATTNLSSSNVRIYPNPTEGTVNLVAGLAKETSGTIEVIDMLGHKLHTENFSGKSVKTSINMNNMKSGLYMMIINTPGSRYQERVFLNNK
jgi:hypothetical protein